MKHNEYQDEKEHNSDLNKHKWHKMSRAKARRLDRAIKRELGYVEQSMGNSAKEFNRELEEDGD